MGQSIEDILTNGIGSEEAYHTISAYSDSHPYSSILQGLRAQGAQRFDPGSGELTAKQSAVRFFDRVKLREIIYKIYEEPDHVSFEEDHNGALAASSVQDDQESIKELDDQLVAAAIGAGAAMDLILHDIEPNEELESSIEEKEDQNDSAAITEQIIELEIPEKQNFSSWMTYLADEALDESTTVATADDSSSFTKAQVASIVDHFIENEHEIVPKRAEFFSPSKAAKGSLVDRQEIVTETLADIYTKQGAIDKAISTYHKLSLLHPEKSSYFAALIEKLKKEETS